MVEPLEPAFQWSPEALGFEVAYKTRIENLVGLLKAVKVEEKKPVGNLGLSWLSWR